MLQIDLLPARNVLFITPEGALDKSDFERLAKELNTIITSDGKLTGLMICLRSFPGWRNFGSFLSHLNFVVGHHRKIERVAVLTHSKFLMTLPRLAGYFLQPTIRSFRFQERDRALAWLQTSERWFDGATHK